MTDCPFDSILARTPYLVIPKMALQAMPMEWRERFAALLNEAQDTGLETPTYNVLRNDPEYTSSFIYEDGRVSFGDQYTIIKTDPWSEYRHATLKDVQALCPTFKPNK